MPVAKKKSRKRVSETELWKLADKALQDFQLSSADRAARAKRVYDLQDNATKDAIDRIQDVLSEIARRHMWVGLAGDSHRVVQVIPDQVVRDNMLYMAVEIMLDLARMDIQVEGFVIPKNLCAECKNLIQPRKRRSGRR